MDRSYLIRYGLMGQVGRFSSDSSRYDRGQTVVVRSYRGTELGEVLIELSDPDPELDPGLVLRAAGSDDLECARQLCYSERTVKNVIHDVVTKFNARSRSQAVAAAVREGLI